jgi:hypothetical protein
VTHSRANFYFLLSPESPEQSELTATMKRTPLAVRKPRDRPPSVRGDTPSPAPGPAPPAPDALLPNVEDFHASKELKGIINEQIKERRSLYSFVHYTFWTLALEMFGFEMS